LIICQLRHYRGKEVALFSNYQFRLQRIPKIKKARMEKTMLASKAWEIFMNKRPPFFRKGALLIDLLNHFG
jgi:hypothetical protein